jgi:hypothetical protein
MMRRVTLAGGLGTTGLLAILGLLHVFWAVRGASSGSAVIPQRAGRPVFRPSRLGTMGVAGCLFAAALTLLARLGIVRLPACVPAGVRATLPQRGAWVLAAIFGLRVVGDFRYVGIFKRVTGTPFARWDTRLFVPVCIIVAAGSALVAAAEPPLRA